MLVRFMLWRPQTWAEFKPGFSFFSCSFPFPSYPPVFQPPPTPPPPSCLFLPPLFSAPAAAAAAPEPEWRIPSPHAHTDTYTQRQKARLACRTLPPLANVVPSCTSVVLLVAGAWRTKRGLDRDQNLRLAQWRKEGRRGRMEAGLVKAKCWGLNRKTPFFPTDFLTEWE